MLEISINPERCIRCGTCIRVCPAAVFKFSVSRVSADHIARCILCGHCVDVCPVNAVVHSEFPLEKMHSVDRRRLPDPEALMLLMKKRRSVRVFRDIPVPRNLLDRILEAAQVSPTARNAQKVKFTLVLSPEMLGMTVRAVIGIYRDNLRLLTGPFTRILVRMIMPGKLEFIPLLERLTGAYDKGKDPILHGAKALLLIHGPLKDPLARNDCNLAYQNASLMAESLGVGQFYTGFLYMASLNDRKRRLNRLLGIEGDIYAGMALGMPAVEYLRFVDRKPLDLKVL